MILSLVAIFCVSIFLIALFWGISVRNSIVEYENRVKRSWSDVLVYEQRKNIVISKLEDIVKDFKNYESDFHSKIVELRNSQKSLLKKDDDINFDEFSNVQKKSDDLLNSIKVTVEDYPELKSDAVFVNLMTETVEQQDNISSAIRIFNNNVEMFNTNIKVFPNNIINENFNKKSEFNLFKTDEKSDIGFDPKL